MEESITWYILSRLSTLKDDQLRGIDFANALSVIDSINIPYEERAKLKRSIMSIQEQIGLYHYGILGMHWGIRRYQNKDGSLTSEGKKKYRDDEAKKSIFGTASKFQIKTRNGEVISANPVKPISMGKKVLNAILGTSEKDELGRRGDANYVLTNSKGEKLGELSLISKSADRAYLDWIIINDNQRGKGYATDIINNLINKAKDSGYSKLELNALKRPRPLYERIGFTYTDMSKTSMVERVMSFELGCKHMEYDISRNKKDSNKSITHSDELYLNGYGWSIKFRLNN